MSVSTDTSSNVDLMAIYQGGDNFLARMKELTDQRSAIERMLAELRLGRAAREAYDEASKLQSQASEALTAANADANRIVENANKSAETVLADAKAKSEKMIADSNEKIVNASKLEETARLRHTNAAEISTNMEKLKAQVVSAQNDAKVAEERFNRKMSILASAMAEIDKL